MYYVRREVYFSKLSTRTFFSIKNEERNLTLPSIWEHIFFLFEKKIEKFTMCIHNNVSK